MRKFRRRHHRRKKIRRGRHLRRRRFSRRARRNAPSRWKVGNFFKDCAFAKLRFEYSYQIDCVAAANAIGGCKINGNSLVPTVQAVGSLWAVTPAAVRSHPIGYSTMSAMYTQYKIYGSKVNFKIMNLGITNASAENGDTFWCTLIPTSSQQSASQVLTVDTISSYPHAKKRLIQWQPITTSKVWTIKHYMSTRKIEGITKAEFEDADYNAATGASPTNIWNWNLLFNTFTHGATSGTNGSNFAVHLTQTFYVKFYRKNYAPTTQ